MKTIIIILMAILGVVFCAGAIYVIHEERRKRKETEKKLKEAYKYENKAAEIISEANNTKNDAISGDIDNDLNYMAGKLHEYASK